MSSPSQGYNIFLDIIQKLQDEGIDLPFQPTINFTGAGVTASDDIPNSRTNITIPGFVAHNLLDAVQNQDTVAQTATRGSLVYGNATPLWDELLKGTNGQFLKSNTLDIIWAGILKADISDFAHNLLSASHGDTVVGTPVLGDLIKGNAGTWQRFLKGTALQQIRVNAGGTDLEYFTPASSTIFNQTIQDEGTSLTQRPTFNFIGAGVTAVDNAGSSRTDITIPGGGSGVDTFILPWTFKESIVTSDRFAQWFSSNDYIGTEGLAQAFLSFAFTVKRATLRVNTNARTGATTLSMRDDGADVPNTALTVPAATTGNFDTGAISEVVGANSLINIKITTAGTGTFSGIAYYAEVTK